jgi:hypothetical protein
MDIGIGSQSWALRIASRDSHHALTSLTAVPSLYIIADAVLSLPITATWLFFLVVFNDVYLFIARGVKIYLRASIKK